MTLTEREVACFNLIGVVCDALGGLYLAYDVFKRHAGLLGLMTRVATYSVVLALPTCLALGPGFGLISGVGLGSLVAFDNWLLARRQRLQQSSPLTQPASSGFLRGIVMGVASMPRFGWRFGLFFMAAAAPLTALVYGRGFIPTYRPYATNRLGSRLPTLRGAVMRSLALGAGAAVAAYALKGLGEAEHFGGLVAFLVAISSLAVALILPGVEYSIEHAPEAFFIYAGLALLMCGLACDSIPPAFVLLTRRP